MQPRVNKNIRRMQAKQPPLKPAKAIKVFGNHLLSSNTEHWYESRVIWTSAGQIVYGLTIHDYYTVTIGVVQIILRLVTKKEIILSNPLKKKK